MTRVVVSGLGVVSPYGVGAKTFWAGLARGDCAIRPVSLIDTEGLRSRIAAEVPAEVLPTLGVSPRRSRADRIALAAAREALAEADLTAADRASMGLFVGAVGGGMLEGEEWYCEEARTGHPSPRRSARDGGDGVRLGRRLNRPRCRHDPLRRDAPRPGRWRGRHHAHLLHG